MSSFCGLESDVFISYAHADNHEGWVEQFHERLFSRLRELDRTAPFSVWRDRKLSGADVFTDEIDRQLKSSGVLISILSPNGIDSNWCQRERENFSLAGRGKGGMRLGTKSRAIRITKSPCPENRDRHLFGDLGYDFYTRSDQRGHFAEIHPSSAEFSARLLEIAQDVYDILKLLRARLAAPPPHISVYVAAVAPDLAAWRQQVADQLAAWNCRVVPEDSDTDRLSKAAIDELLKGCALSVHLIGEDLGALPLDMLQLSCARSAGTERIVCETGETSAGLREMLDTRSEGHEERIRSSASDVLLQYLEERVTALRATPSRTSGADGSLVYVICDPRDEDAALRLKQCLEAERRFEAILPIREVEDENLRLRDHRKWLNKCQAVLIYWGEGMEPAWFREQQREVIGARVKRKKRPLHAVCLSASPKGDPEYYGLPGLPIHQVSGLDCTQIRRHFRLLENGGRR